MAKRSGSKTSRGERRAGKQRAERAREHGLPERREAARRVRASTPEPGSRGDGDDRSSDVPKGRSAKKPGIPTLVKVVAGALVILLGVYILSQRREQALTDTKPAPELPSAQASAAADSETTAVPRPEPASEPEPRASAAPAAAVEPAAVVSVTPPSKPVVAMPLVSAPALPKVPKPVVAAPKPPAPATVPAVAPAAPPKPAAAPEKPDNP
jgi:hypothetical protein